MLLRIIDTSLHDRAMFIKPDKLPAILPCQGLNDHEMVASGRGGTRS